MTLRLLVALLVLASSTPVLGAEETLNLRTHEELPLAHPGATAAYTVDAIVAEASASDGRVTIVARRAGTTQLVVVTADATQTFTLVVTAPETVASARTTRREPTRGATVEGGYDSATDRLSTRVDLFSRGASQVRMHALAVSRLEEGNDSDARVAFPSLALSVGAGSKELVLGDALVQHSALTLDGVSLRGLHARAGGLELRGGITSPRVYQGLFLFAESEAALALSHRVAFGRSSLTPGAFLLSSASVGGVGSMRYDLGAEGDPFHLRAELGYGGAWGGALSLSVVQPGQRFLLDARHKPAGFASLSAGRANGSFVDVAWNRKLHERLDLNVTGSVSRHELSVWTQLGATSQTELRLRLGRRWSTWSGVSLGSQSGTGTSPGYLSATVPVGLSFDAGGLGLSALYRHQRHSLRNEGGHGGRLAARATWSRLQASVYADGQQDAATVDLVFREVPGLERLFTELELDVRSPEELARALRDDPTLAELGYLEGATLDLHPLRLQAGADVVWAPRDRAEQQLRLHAHLDRTQGVARRRGIELASLSYTRRLTGGLSANAGASVWSHDTDGSRSVAGSFNVGLKMTFDGLPRMPWLRARAIEGTITRADGPVPAGLRVRLDGKREVVADARGHYRFDGVGRGAHEVALVLPSGGDLYFTTASSVRVEGGRTADFGLATLPARLFGQVRDDAGGGVAGVTVRLSGGAEAKLATTDTGGGYAFAVIDGEYLVEVLPETVPPGHDLAAATPQPVRLSALAPQRAEHVLPAHRSIAGAIKGARSLADARLSLGGERAIPVGPDGRFLVRGVPPGRQILELAIDGRVVRREVVVPAGPASLRGIDLDAASPSI